MHLSSRRFLIVITTTLLLSCSYVRAQTVLFEQLGLPAIDSESVPATSAEQVSDLAVGSFLGGPSTGALCFVNRECFQPHNYGIEARD